MTNKQMRIKYVNLRELIASLNELVFIDNCNGIASSNRMLLHAALSPFYETDKE